MDRRRRRVLYIWIAQVPGDKVFSVGQHHKFLSTVCGTVLGAGYQHKRIWSQKLPQRSFKTGRKDSKCITSDKISPEHLPESVHSMIGQNGP